MLDADFHRDITRNPVNAHILARWGRIDLPHAWLVAGCLFQTVWNLQAGRAPDADIKDVDLFYFDPTDLGEDAERQAAAHVRDVLGDLGLAVDVANQARVHLWYPGHFGRPYDALTSAEEGIASFLVRETCVGIRPGQCVAPYGLQGIYACTLTPNPRVPYPELFARKAASYRARWPHLAWGAGAAEGA